MMFRLGGIERITLAIALTTLSVAVQAAEVHDNLWSVPRAGGIATRLNADDGRDVMPRFSPDGRWIAFTGEYQGNRDVYVIPALGGPAKRLTFNSDISDEPPVRWGPNNMVVTWTPDSSNIVFLSRREAWNTVLLPQVRPGPAHRNPHLGRRSRYPR